MNVRMREVATKLLDLGDKVTHTIRHDLLLFNQCQPRAKHRAISTGWHVIINCDPPDGNNYASFMSV